MKTLTVALPLLLTLPLACGGTVESDSSKNDGVVGVVGDPDADESRDAGTTGSSVDSDEPGTTGSSVDSDEPDSDEPDEPSSDDDDGVEDPTDGGIVDDDEPGDNVVRLPAIAQTRAQLELLWAAEENGTTGTTGGDFPELDPDDLFLKISDLGAVCSEAHIALSCGQHWSLSIALPPVYQAVGVYDLNDPLIAQYSSMSETGEPYSPAPEDCSWGGGSILGGSIEVLAIDENAVRFRVDVTPTFETNPSGVYTAVRCE